MRDDRANNARTGGTVTSLLDSIGRRPRASSEPAATGPLLGRAPNHNLPVALTGFIGRTRETVAVVRLLSASRLLTLIGPPGVGKTRLALEVAADLVSELADGAWLVELAPLSDPALVPQAVAAVLGVRERPDQTSLATLTESLHSKRMLLLLDNCEHVLEASAVLADGLLRACPELRIIATSREPLGTAGETIFSVPTLTLPDAEVPLQGERLVDDLLASEAGSLFGERARAAWPEFTVTGTNAPAVARVCRRLDGIPLALELAAVRVRALTIDQIADRLDDRFQLLTGGSRVALRRQQTLRAAIDWSYDLLSEPERVLMRRLTVFAGGWNLEAAEAVSSWNEIDASDVLDLLQHLVDKSLVVAEARQDGTIRYRMLETLHQYAHERLVESGEADEARRRHAAYWLALAERAERELRGPREREWSTRLEDAGENPRAALRWTIERGEAEVALRLVGALWRFWEIRGQLVEGLAWLEQALALHAANDSATTELLRARGGALNGAGALAWARGEYARSAAFHDEGLALWRRLSDPAGEAMSLQNLGMAYRNLGDRAGARACISQSLGLFRTLGNTRYAALALLNLGRLSHDEGDVDQATTFYEESLTLFRADGNAQGLASVLNRLGDLARNRGSLATADQLHDEALGLHRHRGDPWGIGITLTYLARVAAARRDPVATMALAGQALRALHEAGARHDAAAALVLVAAALGVRGDATLGARLLGAVARADPNGFPIPAEQVSFEQSVTAARGGLGDEAFAAAWESGQRLTLDQAVDLALAAIEPAASGPIDPPAPEPIEPAWPSPGSMVSVLSRREREVASLIADGLTNREIAETLIISEATVDSHVSHILRKLRVRSRAQVAIWAVGQGPPAAEARSGPGMS